MPVSGSAACSSSTTARPRHPSAELFVHDVLPLRSDRKSFAVVSSNPKSSKGGAMSKRVFTTLGLFVLLAACAVAQTSADKRTIQVDINYTGSGTVNASHKIYVALWDSS